MALQAGIPTIAASGIITSWVFTKGFKVEFHKEHWLQNHRLQLDLFIPDLRTVVEVDGPSHFKPVWGMENLIKNQK